MLLGRKLLICIAIVAIFSGCASQPEPEQEPQQPAKVKENLAIVQATADLEQAQSMNAEWMVREKSIHPHPITLGQILEQAKTAHLEGHEAEAIRLARIVSKFARLGVAQALEQATAAPYYPQ
jgi:Tfp pilus assembly protein PilF